MGSNDYYRFAVRNAIERSEIRTLLSGKETLPPTDAMDGTKKGI